MIQPSRADPHCNTRRNRVGFDYPDLPYNIQPRRVFAATGWSPLTSRSFRVLFNIVLSNLINIHNLPQEVPSELRELFLQLTEIDGLVDTVCTPEIVKRLLLFPEISSCTRLKFHSVRLTPFIHCKPRGKTVPVTPSFLTIELSNSVESEPPSKKANVFTD